MTFREWLMLSIIKEHLLNEMPFTFGKYNGKSVQQVTDTAYLQWALENLQRMNPQLRAEIETELRKRQSQPQVQSQQARPQQPQPSRLSAQPASGWIWAKSLIAMPAYDIPAPNLNLAMRQYDPSNWMFVILDPEEGRLVSRGLIPTMDLKNVVQSQKDATGNLLRRNKPTEILEAITPKKDKKTGGLIPDHHITGEQKAIDEKFANMLNSPGQSHMVISALAGSGKTTVLKHLAWKYGQGKRWLYLVFGTKNKEEAKEEFPPSIVVDTTNAWAGREVLGKNVLQPTDRIQQFSQSDKAKMVADSASFTQIMKSLSIPNPIEIYGPDPKRLGGTERSLWYTLRSISSEFKTEAVKLLGLLKAFAIDPRNEVELDQNMQAVMQKYDLNVGLTDIKENIEKNSPWATPYLNRLMGKDFLERDFTQELMQATKWLMQQVMPHASQEKFIADSGQQQGTEQNLGTKRDFDDDLWFSAIHANELKWPKYDVVLADEVQDFNVAQQIILRKLAENGAKIVAVGDENQSIYRFRGADSDAFSSLKGMLKDMSHDPNIEQNLTQNFRSRQAVIDFTNQEGAATGHVSNLVKGRPFKEDPGRIGRGRATKYEVAYPEAFETLQKEMKDMGEIKQTAFLSRTNEPLVHASLNLMKLGLPFIILGKDIANDLNKHIDRIINLFRLRNDASIMELESSIRTYHEEQNDKHAGKAAMSGKLKEIKEVTDAMSSSIKQFAEEAPEGTVMDFRKWLRSKFGGLDIEKGGREGEAARAEFKKKVKELNPVILSTVHKSKGLQFQRVYILRDDMWPHPRASREEDLRQEMNNKYIGRTRAEDELHIIQLDGQPGYKPRPDQEEEPMDAQY